MNKQNKTVVKTLIYLLVGEKVNHVNFMQPIANLEDDIKCDLYFYCCKLV